MNAALNILKKASLAALGKLVGRPKPLGSRYLYFDWSNPVKASNYNEPRIPRALAVGVSKQPETKPAEEFIGSLKFYHLAKFLESIKC